MVNMHPMPGPEHFERRIKAKKRPQKVLLIPESAAIKYPLLWVFYRHKDVVGRFRVQLRYTDPMSFRIHHRVATKERARVAALAPLCLKGRAGI